MAPELIKRRGALVSEITDEAVVVGGGPTWALRHSDYPLWREIREWLLAHGVDASTAVVADSYELAAAEIGPAVAEVGVVVAQDGRVLRYRKSYETGEWEDWSEITADWLQDEHAEAIQPALRALGHL